MIQKQISGPLLPEFHSDMLLVKLVPSYAAALHSAAMASPRMAVAGGVAVIDAVAPAVAGLQMLDKRGSIVRLTPISRRAESSSNAMAGIMALASASSSQQTTDGDRVTSGSSLVELAAGSDLEECRRILANDPGIDSVSLVPVRYVKLPAKTRRGPAASGRAKSAIGIASAAPDLSAMWNLRAIKWNEARQLPQFTDAATVRVAVLDTGVDRTHPDLKGRVTQYIFKHADIPKVVAEPDIVGHGTHVSGTIGALINNNVGINGICACDLNVWKIFSDQTAFDGVGSFVYFVDPVMYLRALTEALDAKVDVMNLSIGGTGKPSAQELQAFNLLIANGAAVVAAMGNERQEGSPTSYPAAIDGVFAVGATKIDDNVADFSNRGDHISLCAPGKGIWSTLPRNPGQTGFAAVRGADGKLREGKPLRRETDYDAWDGTSMATPHVTAAIALFIANKGRMKLDKLRAALQHNLDHVPAMGSKKFTSDFGFGRLNLLRLLQ
jgi:subtilisin family serine protease